MATITETRRRKSAKAKPENGVPTNDADVQVNGAATKDDKPSRPMKAPPPCYRPFPLAALPPVLRDLAERGAESIGCDPAYVITPAWAVSAGLVGTARYIRLVDGEPGWKEPAVIWAVTVGRSSSKKTVAWRLVNHAVLQLQREMTLLAQSSLGVRHRQILVTDATMEALKAVLQRNERGVLYSRDEISAWFSSFTKYRNTGSDLGDWLELSNAGDILKFRVAKENDSGQTFIHGACCSVAGTITPGMLAKALGGEMFEAGTPFRILFTMPPKKLNVVDLKKKVDFGITEAWKGCCRKLIHLEGEHVLVPVPAALQMFQDYANANEQRIHVEDGPMESALGKLTAYAARLALMHYLMSSPEKSNGQGKIPVESVQAGIAIAKWYAVEAERALPMRHQSEDDVRLRNLAERIHQRGGAITRRQLQNTNSKRYRSKEDAQADLEELVAGGWGELVGKFKFQLFREETPATIEQAPAAADPDEPEIVVEEAPAPSPTSPTLPKGNLVATAPREAIEKLLNPKNLEGRKCRVCELRHAVGMEWADIDLCARCEAEAAAAAAMQAPPEHEPEPNILQIPAGARRHSKTSNKKAGEA